MSALLPQSKLPPANVSRRNALAALATTALGVIRPMALAASAVLAAGLASSGAEANAGRWDCGSEIVPIVHVESVGPVCIESSLSGSAQSQALLQQHDDQLLGQISPVQAEGCCGWGEDIQSAPHPPATAAMLAGMATGSRWMHFTDPSDAADVDSAADDQDGAAFKRFDISTLWSLASQTLDHLAETQWATASGRNQPKTFVSPAANAVARSSVNSAAVNSASGNSAPVISASDLLVGGSAFVFTLAEEYQPYDLAKSDLPVWSSLAVEYQPFSVYSKAVLPTTLAQHIPTPIADPVPNGDDDAESLAVADQIADIELQLAEVLSEASTKMVAQRRADRAFASVLHWVQNSLAAWKIPGDVAIASRDDGEAHQR